MFQCLPDGDNTNGLSFVFFSVSYYYCSALNETYPNPAVFIILIASIQSNQHRAIKNFRGIGKVKTVLADIAPVFSLVPLKFRIQIVTTLCKYVNSECESKS